MASRRPGRRVSASSSRSPAGPRGRHSCVGVLASLVAARGGCSSRSTSCAGTAPWVPTRTTSRACASSPRTCRAPSTPWSATTSPAPCWTSRALSTARRSWWVPRAGAGSAWPCVRAPRTRSCRSRARSTSTSSRTRTRESGHGGRPGAAPARAGPGSRGCWRSRSPSASPSRFCPSATRSHSPPWCSPTCSGSSARRSSADVPPRSPLRWSRVRSPTGSSRRRTAR